MAIRYVNESNELDLNLDDIVSDIEDQLEDEIVSEEYNVEIDKNPEVDYTVPDYMNRIQTAITNERDAISEYDTLYDTPDLPDDIKSIIDEIRNDEKDHMVLLTNILDKYSIASYPDNTDELEDVPDMDEVRDSIVELPFDDQIVSDIDTPIIESNNLDIPNNLYKLIGEWSSQRSDLEDLFTDAGYDVLDSNSEYIVVSDEDDEEYIAYLGGTSRTITIDKIVHSSK